MPIVGKCSKCGGNASLGFNMVNGGIYYYHGDIITGRCGYWKGNDGNLYDTQLDMIRATVFPFAKGLNIECWKKAREYDLTGRPRLAKKYYKLWNDAQ